MFAQARPPCLAHHPQHRFISCIFVKSCNLAIHFLFPKDLATLAAEAEGKDIEDDEEVRGVSIPSMEVCGVSISSMTDAAGQAESQAPATPEPPKRKQRKRKTRKTPMSPTLSSP